VAVTVRQLAELVHGKVSGDGELLVQSARTLEEAQPGDITFLDHARHAAKLGHSAASAAIVPAGITVIGKTLIEVADPLAAFIAIVRHLLGKTASAPTGIDPRAAVHPSAIVGDDPSIDACVFVGAGSTIGRRVHLHSGVVVGKNCRLGDDVILYPNVVLYDDTAVGDRAIIHANATIGADGFGYRFQNGQHVKVPQLGNVVIGSDVEIGANSTIDRGTFGATVIGDGTKIDNLVQIGHNCRIGKHNVFAGQVGIAGSCSTGDYVVMGGQVGVADHIHIGNGAMVGAKTGIVENVRDGQRMFLYPAHEEHDAARIIRCIKKLPAMRKDLLRVLKELKLAETRDPPAAAAPEAPAA